MGIFNKKKKKTADQFLDSILSARKQLETSPNYQFSCNYLKNSFFADVLQAEDCIFDPEPIDTLIAAALTMGEKRGCTFPDKYGSLGIHFYENQFLGFLGYIIELEDAKIECECNFVALIVVDGEKRYFTSEFYKADNSFFLCEFTVDKHMSYSNVTNTYDAFRDALDEKMTQYYRGKERKTVPVRPEKNVIENKKAESQTSIRFCRMCGSKLIDGSLYCSQCGTKVLSDDSE